MDGVSENMVVGVGSLAFWANWIQLAKIKSEALNQRLQGLSQMSDFCAKVTTEAIAGEGMIVTAGGLDMHVPRQPYSFVQYSRGTMHASEKDRECTMQCVCWLRCILMQQATSTSSRCIGFAHNRSMMPLPLGSPQCMAEAVKPFCTVWIGLGSMIPEPLFFSWVSCLSIKNWVLTDSSVSSDKFQRGP